MFDETATENNGRSKHRDKKTRGNQERRTKTRTPVYGTLELVGVVMVSLRILGI